MNQKQTVSSRRVKTPLSVEQIQGCVQRLRGDSETTLFLPEVASALGVTGGQLRSVVSNARKKKSQSSSVSWQQLGISVGVVTDARIAFAQLLRRAHSPTAQAVIVHEVLELHREGELSRQAAHVIIYAVLTRECTYEKLDVQYSKLFSLRPHSVSNLLHDSRSSKRHIDGVFASIDTLLQERFVEEQKNTTAIKRYREFARDFLKLERINKEHTLFEVFLNSETLSPALGALLKNALQVVEKKTHCRRVLLNRYTF